MAQIRIPRGWEIAGPPTPESTYLNRRRFLRRLGLAGVGLVAGPALGAGERAEDWQPHLVQTPTSTLYPARRNPAFDPGRPLTAERIAGTYNNFYEFADGMGGKEAVHRLGRDFAVRPWQVRVDGLVRRPQTFDIDELVRQMPLEERLYRFRCVEAWAMTVPWTGFPLSALVERVEPMASARYLRLVSFLRPEEAPNQKRSTWYPWPYYEGLTLAEAQNELTLLATGIYGHELPVQHGAPVRLVVPWKYGYKSIKSIVRIEFVEERPPTFWNDLAPREYDFWSNVDPLVPHPRWSQAHERLIDSGEVVPTLPYNGYGAFVADLYAG